jgi:3'-5' exonuclease
MLLFPEFSHIAGICCLLVDDKFKIVQEKIFIDEENYILHSCFNAFNRDCTLIGHNIKGFDIPFLAKRYLANRMIVPNSLRVGGKKPWEITHIDTMELFKFGGFINTSLESLSILLGLPNPKDNYSGVDFHKLFESGDLSEANEYLLNDCKTVLEILKIYKELCS